MIYYSIHGHMMPHAHQCFITLICSYRVAVYLLPLNGQRIASSLLVQRCHTAQHRTPSPSEGPWFVVVTSADYR